MLRSNRKLKQAKIWQQSKYLTRTWTCDTSMLYERKNTNVHKTRMKLKSIMLNKGGKKLKTACCIIHLLDIQRRQILSIEQKAYQSSKGCTHKVYLNKCDSEKL